MSGRSAWTRLHCSTRASDVRRGLEARIADPLWMLSRQRQFGAFAGDNAASPARIEVETEVRELGEMLPPNTTTPRPLDRDDLIEPIVEAQDIAQGPAALRAAGQAGLAFLRMLPSRARTRLLPVLQERLPLPAPAPSPGPEAQGRNGPVLRALARGSFDARGLLSGKLSAADLAEPAGMTEAQVAPILSAWAAAMQDRFVPPSDRQTWVQARMEHIARLRSMTQGNEVTLTAAGYAGGHLDWSDFDISRATGNNKIAGRRNRQWLLPTPISYSGMPAERFWDFEEGAVFFGGLSLEKTDLAQLILTEFATVYSNDWFMVPLPTPSGTLSRITALRVHDSFGEVTEVKATAVEDRNGPRPWRFFELFRDPSPRQNLAPWLYLPRAAIGGEASRPVEAVRFLRDEQANLAWGVETTVEGGGGHPVDRAQLWARIKDQLSGAAAEAEGQPVEDAATQAPADPLSAPWSYRLLTSAPPHWVPFLPGVSEDGLPTADLIRARMQEWSLLGPDQVGLAGPQGQLMNRNAPMRLNEEELAELGIEVTRHYQTARTPDGRLLLWASNRKRPAPKTPASGRQTDVIERPKR